MVPFLNIYIPLVMDIIMMNDTSSSEDEPVVLYNDSSDESNSEDMDSDDSEYIPGRSNSISVSSRGRSLISEEVLQGLSSVSEPRAGTSAPLLAPTPSVQQNVAVAQSVEGASAVKSTPRDSGEDDGQICTICFEPWTNSSIHRLVSLRCGHLFGRSCITRWLKGQNPRCPQCNARARKSEIRNIYAKAVKVLDSTERDKALQDLTRETELRRKAEIDAAQSRLKHMLAVQDCERLKRELMIKDKIIQDYRANMKPSNSSQAAKSAPAFYVDTVVEVTKSGGCRIIDASDLLGMILVSQPSTNPLFPGFGFRKVSYHDMKPSEFCLIHTKPIRDMAFHDNDGLVLTASLDKTLKITNMITNCQVQTYHVDSDVWSCAWDADDPMYFYGGLKTGEVYVFDIRVTSRHVYQLPRFGAQTPVVSLQYLKSPAMSVSPRKCGPIVGKLSDCALQQKTEIPDFYKIVSLPLLGSLTSLSSDCSGHFLVSSRPSVKQPCVNHTLCNFVATPNGDLLCNPITTVLGGKNQLQLTRSKLLNHPDNETSVLLCAGDEDAHGALIWDGSSGACIERLRTNSPVLDFAGLKIEHRAVLAALTGTTLRLYKWTGNV